MEQRTGYASRNKVDEVIKTSKYRIPSRVSIREMMLRSPVSGASVSALTSMRSPSSGLVG
jgi:hypothetical protein